MGFGELLFFGLLVAFANVAGGLLLARPAIFRPSRHFLSYLVALGAGFMLAAIMAVPAQAQAPRKIVFLAGPKEHGDPGRHEYEKDLRELACSQPLGPTYGGTKQCFGYSRTYMSCIPSGVFSHRARRPSPW